MRSMRGSLLVAVLLGCVGAFHSGQRPTLTGAILAPPQLLLPLSEKPLLGQFALRQRLRNAAWLPKGDALDKQIGRLYFPSLANLLVVPITGAVDTCWVGRMGDALALAGQGAANQLFTSIAFLASFVPTVTVPLVASAYARGDLEGARERTCDSLFLAGVIGLAITIFLVGCPQQALRVLLPADSLAVPYASRYLRLRSLSLVAAIFSSVAFAAFRGCLDVVTPLKVGLASNGINLLLDPLLIFGVRLGVAGAAIATVMSEVRLHVRD